MLVKLLNIVVFAENYKALVNWYKDVLNLEELTKEEGVYNYTELGFDKKVIVGIAPVNEIEHTPRHPRNNSLVMQL
ncbi:MAG: hypothetical protein AAGK97_15910 [Bacteroidota bacterium]